MTKHSIAALAAAALLGIAALASADDKQDPNMGQKGKEGMGGMAAQPEHANHLAMVDYYLITSINDAKLLAALSDMEQVDRKMVMEAQKNLGMAINKAIVHAKPLEKDITMASEFRTQLQEAKTVSKKLARAKKQDMTGMVDQLATHLAAADQSFRQIATAQGFTRLETRQLGAIPVRGTEEQQQEIDEQQKKDQEMKEQHMKDMQKGTEPR
jgi:hypothetical protein